jgi:hypothetical protein
VVFAVVVLVALVAPPVPAAPSDPAWTIAYDEEVSGDLVVAGNSVTRCPPDADVCRAAEQGTANGALNNDYAMVWTDTDDDSGTVTSSSARLAVPAGARIVHATLSWSGTLQDGSSGQCGRSGQWPAGSPGRVVLAVGGAAASALSSTSFFAAPAAAGSDRWYSAHAEVTDRVAGRRGPVELTVGNVWTGQGRDCVGGWAVTAVWARDGAPRHRVTVYTGHQRVDSGPVHTTLRPPALRAAGGTTRLGVVALEGDRGIGNDTLRVGGRALPEPTGLGGPDNFFVAGATGASDPAHPDNMSVDAKVVELGPDVVRPGATEVDVLATPSRDHFLLDVLALSVPLPGITLTTTVDRPVVHVDEDVTQRAVVTNTGALPLRGVEVAFGMDPACATTVGGLAAGEHTEVRCTGRPGATDLPVSARATDPGGGAVTARASASVHVIRPALAVRVTTPHAVVVAGETVDHDVVITNPGDVPLSAVRLRAPGCDRVVAAALAAGASLTVRCTATAAPDPVTASAVDELGKPVTASSPAPYRIVRLGLTIDVVVPDEPPPAGEAMTLTVRVRNTSDVSLTNVTVSGEPAACHRSVPALAPGEAIVYTCRVVVDGPMRVALVASGLPTLPGRPTTVAFTVRRTAVVDLAPRTEPVRPEPAQNPVVAPPPPTPPEPRRASDSGPLRSPVTPAIIAVLGVLVMTVSVGGLSAATRPR